MTTIKPLLSLNYINELIESNQGDLLMVHK